MTDSATREDNIKKLRVRFIAELTSFLVAVEEIDAAASELMGNAEPDWRNMMLDLDAIARGYFSTLIQANPAAGG